MNGGGSCGLIAFNLLLCWCGVDGGLFWLSFWLCFDCGFRRVVVCFVVTALGLLGLSNLGWFGFSEFVINSVVYCY